MVRASFGTARGRGSAPEGVLKGRCETAQAGRWRVSGGGGEWMSATYHSTLNCVRRAWERVAETRLPALHYNVARVGKSDTRTCRYYPHGKTRGFKVR